MVAGYAVGGGHVLHMICDLTVNLILHMLAMPFIICQFHDPIKSLRTSLPGELRLASHATSPGWHVHQ